MKWFKDTFLPRQPLASIPADWLNSVSRALNSVEVYGFTRFWDGYRLQFIPSPSSSGVIDFSFRTVKTGDLTASMTPGGVSFGPDTRIEWGEITNAATTITATAGNTEWHVWLKINVEDLTAEWLQGASVTALSGDDLKKCLNVRLAALTIADDVITAVKNEQCGDVLIPRA